MRPGRTRRINRTGTTPNAGDEGLLLLTRAASRGAKAGILPVDTYRHAHSNICDRCKPSTARATPSRSPVFLERNGGCIPLALVQGQQGLRVSRQTQCIHPWRLPVIERGHWHKKAEKLNVGIRDVFGGWVICSGRLPEG